jgi:hypothetical protein
MPVSSNCCKPVFKDIPLKLRYEAGSIILQVKSMSMPEALSALLKVRHAFTAERKLQWPVEKADVGTGEGLDVGDDEYCSL